MTDQLDNSVVPRSMRRRDYGGFRAPAPEAPAGPATQPTRSFGFESGAGPGERLAAARAPELAGAGGALGEPTSFRGGVGAPMPVEVVRGGRTTYTNPAPDSPGGGYNPTAARNTQEFASPLQAQQAWNRGMRSEAVAAGDRRGFTTPEATLDAQYGGFRAPGQTLEEVKGASHVEAAAAYNKNPASVAAANIAEQKQQEAVKAKVGTDFEGRALKRYGVYKDGKLGRPAEEHVLRDLDEAKEYAMEQGNPQAGHQYMEWSQRLREMYPDVYTTTMKTNPLAWRDIVITHGPQIPATRTTAPAAAPGFTENDKFLSGQTPYSVGP